MKEKLQAISTLHIAQFSTNPNWHKSTSISMTNSCFEAVLRNITLVPQLQKYDNV